MWVNVATGNNVGSRVEELDRPIAGTDTDCVRAALAGDSGAYGVLYDRYARLVRVVCHDATGNLVESQDLCQEVFLRAYRTLGRLRDPERFAGWLLGIARMTCREWGRQARREGRRRRPLTVDPIAPEDEQEGAVHADRVLEAIAGLPERERLALHLFYLQEHPVEVAQQMMSLSRSGLYRVLDRARRRLRQLMGDKGEPGK